MVEAETRAVSLEDERVAVHEIGHALMAVLLGRGVRRVRLRPRPETETEKKVALPRGRPKTGADKALMEGEIMLLIAGVCAERVLGLEERSSLTGALDDLARATDLIVRVAGRARAENVLTHHLSKVERMLAQRNEVLTTAAAELARTGHLDQSRVKQLIPRR